MSILPVYRKVRQSMRNVDVLIKQLKQCGKDCPETKEENIFSLEKITLDNVFFSYSKKQILGPFSLEVKKGETIFVVGDNGSGKSTLLKLLMGLYYPTSGKVKINETVVTIGNMSHYREFFCSIFSDFYLFPKLYGLEIKENLKEWIAWIGLQGQISIKDGRFSSLALSTGQKRRLALLVGLLEKKEICVFDEPTCNQDKNFREFFYTSFLKELRALGKTIVVVSHDEEYFGFCDKLVQVQEGKTVP
jgi:putative ATP-binding cassette transporter